MHTFPFDVVGFDLDGTLLDTSGDLGVALNHALRHGGFPTVPMETVPSLVGGGTRVMLKRGIEWSGGSASDEDITALTAQLVAHYEANIAAHTRLYAGGSAMLDALEARGVRLALVTNKMERLAVKLLTELGLAERFATIIGGDTLGPDRQKPKPDLLHLMVERTGAKAPAFIGDTTFDTGAARAAGIPCVAVSFGFCNLAPHELGADAVIDHYDDLVATLEGMGASVA